MHAVDPSDRIQELDSGQYLRSLEAKSQFVAEGFQRGLEAAASLPRPPRPYGLLFAGMGFSGVASDLIKDACARALDTPFTIVKHYQIPHHVKAGWHLMAISYSGNTEETLSITNHAIARGIPVTAFTTGGQLAGLTDQVVRQPENHQPRGATAYTWASILGYLHESGMLPDEIPVKAMQEAISSVDAQFGTSVPVERNLAKQWAASIVDKIPQIYATPSFYGVGKFFRGLLNENAKKIADVDLIPECNHNDLTGWGDDPLREHFSIMTLSHGNQNPQNQARIDHMRERYESWGLTWQDYQLQPIETFQDHLVEQARAMQFTDYVAFYTAMLRGLDPSEIREITGLKQKLRES